MTRSLLTGLAMVLPLACGNGGNIPLGSLDGGWPSPPGPPNPGPPSAPAAPPDCGTTSACWSLRAAYATALEGARSCNPAAGDPCSVKVPDSLGCHCEVYVNDAAPLAMLRQQFQQAGCDRCFFTAGPGPVGAAPATRCPAIVCPTQGGPTCSPSSGIAGGDPMKGTCSSATVHVCPPGLTAGSPCSVGNQYCFGGSHNACRCGPDTGSVWECS